MACSGSFVALAAIAGVLPDELDEVLLADLDRFGEERGHVAHSRVDRVRTLNSPNIEYERARAIVDALKGFDEIVEAVGESKSGSACKQSQAGPGSQAIIRDRYRRDNGHFSIPHVTALVGNRRKSFLVIGSQVSLSGGTSTPDLGF